MKTLKVVDLKKPCRFGCGGVLGMGVLQALCRYKTMPEKINILPTYIEEL